MVPRVDALFRRGSRPRSADDDDWGTSAPEPPIITMDMDSNPVQSNPLDLDAIEQQQHNALPKPPPTTVDRLRAQQLTSYTVIFSPSLVISLYFAIGFIFIPIGASIVVGSANLFAIGPTRYDNDPSCNATTGKDTMNCTFKFQVLRTIEPPIYFYYGLANYFQNARKYAKSRSDTMNQGFIPKAAFDVETCSPWLYKPEILLQDQSFDIDKLIYPCGLTARSFFNDSFELYLDENNSSKIDNTDKPIALSKDGIAWWTDRNHKFQPGTAPQFKANSTEPNDDVTANQLLEDEDFHVWMRLAAFPDFLKLYRIINKPLNPGQYIVKINSQYPVQAFLGTKSFYITTTEWFGSENAFLGTSFLVVGFIAFCIATILLVKHIRHPRLPASSDPSIILRELAKLQSEDKS